jgi:hypothetical protein
MTTKGNWLRVCLFQHQQIGLMTNGSQNYRPRPKQFRTHWAIKAITNKRSSVNQQKSQQTSLAFYI